ncbi:MAG: SIR2 family protein [Rhizobiales bacterium]|nr:SIR2 family protein [Hyphomicrobiales bacterium]
MDENMKTHDPIRELSEIREQLSYTKRIGFLFGAGTSKAIGLPDIADLTKLIDEALSAEEKKYYGIIKDSLPVGLNHIEGILNKVRLIREITDESQAKSFDGINGENAKNLDKKICDEIYDIIFKAESSANIDVSRKFITWLNHLPRDFSKEIFTTNYDLVIEKAFESLLIPYFDGFVGSNEPFFCHESLEAKSLQDRPPVSWIRLWKLHGSLGWFWKTNDGVNPDRVIRLSAGAKKDYPDAELVIYPSRDKYESSRKQPFTSYFDRLRDFSLSGEGVFIISGYSFSDEHINELIFSCLKQNNRLHVLAFFYSDEPIKKIVAEHKNYPNLTMIGKNTASISGVFGEWANASVDELIAPFWDDSSKSVSLGDYKKLVEFLTLCSGKGDA